MAFWQKNTAFWQNHGIHGTAFDENHGFRDLRVSVIIYCPYSYCKKMFNVRK